jgi:hypothetical protein
MTTKDVSVCAFTTKAMKFSRMMRRLGYRTILYWGEDNEAECDEHVPLYTREEQKAWYGDLDANTLPSRATWNAADVQWRTMNGRAVAEIASRWEHGDLLLILAGLAQERITQALPNYLACEWAAGYEGWHLPYVCFESYAWMNWGYGNRGIKDGRWYDTVIPNFFDEDEWPVNQGGGDYLLFVGRMIARKGPHVAAQIAQEVGMPIKFAGSGVTSASSTRIECEGWGFDGVDMEYVGTVGGDERARLMAGARALICPTTYIEPFGAVAVEAQICGTPAIATDWGAFPETIIQGAGGYRFRTLREGVDAVEQAAALDPVEIRRRALERYSLDAVGPEYDRWFKQLLGLYEGGWYAGTSHATPPRSIVNMAGQPRAA